VTAEIRRGKKEERNHRAKIYCPHLLRRAAINKMGLSAEDLVLIKVVRQEKGYDSR